MRLSQVDRANFNGTFIFGSDVVRDASGNPVAGVNGEQSVISGLDLYRLVLAGAPGYRPSQFSIVSGDPAVALSIVEGSWFAQDDWRAASRLTISYGIRHEIQHYDGLRMRFAPRAGLAWAPTADGNSAVRAGVGLFYTQIPHRLFSDALRLDGRHGQRLVVDRPAFFPGVPDPLPGVQDLTATIRTQSPDLTMPMMFVSTVSYDRKLVGSLFGSIGYTWRRGADLLRTRNIGVRRRRHRDTECPDHAVRVDGAFERSRSQRQRERHDRPGRDGVWQLRVSRARCRTPMISTVSLPTQRISRPSGRCARGAASRALGGTINLPDDYAVYPFVTWSSELPFNITSGNDTNLDLVFTDRPSFAEPGSPVR